MNLLITYLVIGIGSALGGIARYGCGVFAVTLWGPEFPWGTIFINVLGSLVIGGFAALTEPEGRMAVGALGRQFVMIGLCGGYTTFSGFSLESFDLVRAGRSFAAAANVTLSVVLCLFAVWLAQSFVEKIYNR